MAIRSEKQDRDVDECSGATRPYPVQGRSQDNLNVSAWDWISLNNY